MPITKSVMHIVMMAPSLLNHFRLGSSSIGFPGKTNQTATAVF